ncbi:hypothetical protein [Chlamydia caviae]|uniref:Uncharacterized protein n=1 Tax=Chlamydia caviae (strain ATCC VR-813 / DSM 19441 / 03DC25 / GPIC) TaxID=227941 RepID=Q822V9_CHLCV|nr:hypothetical protein [Chlamydia caviae]AAP05312.1 hypothetical protein CCA_00570 [Chlamydia caviae GPIC]
MISCFFSSAIFSHRFLKDLPKIGRGSGYLESLAERVDRLLQLRDRSRVLYIDKINIRGQLVYVDIRIPLLFQERVRTLFLYLLIIPAIIAFIIKVVVRITLYCKYGGWERWSERTASLIDPSLGFNEHPPYIFSKEQLKSMNFYLPSLGEKNMESILNEHQRLRDIGSKSVLNRMGVGIKSKTRGSDILGDDDDIFFIHPEFPRLEFESIGQMRINNQVGYSAQEWADMHVLEYLALQREQLSKLRGFINSRIISIRRIRTDPAGNHVLIIREC